MAASKKVTTSAALLVKGGPSQNFVRLDDRRTTLRNVRHNRRELPF